MKDRTVLACSGGLDTSVAIGWIAEETKAEGSVELCGMPTEIAQRDLRLDK